MAIHDTEFFLSNYDFYLPPELIAQYPPKKRSESRLLVVDRSKKNFFESCISDIHHFIPENSVVVFNNSKVIPARIYGTKKKTGGKVEFLLLTPIPLLDIKNEGKWQSAICDGLIKTRRSLASGAEVEFSRDFHLKIIEKGEFGRYRVKLIWQGDLLNILQKIGHVPLPPYIKRDDKKEDFLRYQTIFARDDKAGSVAAPTAGLHFDEDLLKKIQQKVKICFISLYVGLGTFSPIRCEDIRDHKMHKEFVEIPKESAKIINETKDNGGKVIAVGTTTVRSLEGVFEKLKKIDEYSGWLDTYIYPGFKFNVVDHMITNFHLPKSSLIVMVSAFASRELILSAYNYAIKRGFRFFSYGDCMLIL